MEKLRVGLNTALFNAGLLGFIEMLDSNNIKYDDSVPNEIEIDAKKLAEVDLAQMYIDAVIDKFKKSTRVYRALENIERLLNFQVSDEEKQKEFKNTCKDISIAFTQQSIKTGLQTLASEGIVTNILDSVKELNSQKDVDKCKEILGSILNDLTKEKVLQTLYMKNIMYNKINMIWTNISFLNRHESNSDIKQSFHKAFAMPLLDMIGSDKKGKKQCSNCGSYYDNLKSYSYLNDVGMDTAKKKSAYWNYNPDLMVCPFCNFIFACSPLGFNQLGQDLVFVNENRSIESLNNSNGKLKTEEESKENYRYKIISTLILEEAEVKEKEIDNIEVLIRHKGGDKEYYILDIIDRSLIKILSNCKNELNLLKNRRMEISSKGYINIAEEALSRLLGRRSQWDLINNLLYSLISKLIKENGNPRLLKESGNPYDIGLLLNIEIKRKEEKSVGFKINRARKLWDEGYLLKNHFESDSANENKLRGIIYKLQNAIRVEDKDLFFDLLIRMYSSINKSIPDSFLQIMESDESFKEIGTAFILGALGSKSEKSEDKEEKKE